MLTPSLPASLAQVQVLELVLVLVLECWWIDL